MNVIKPVSPDGFLREWLALGPIAGNPAALLGTSEIREDGVAAWLNGACVFSVDAACGRP